MRSINSYFKKFTCNKTYFKSKRIHLLFSFLNINIQQHNASWEHFLSGNKISNSFALQSTLLVFSNFNFKALMNFLRKTGMELFWSLVAGRLAGELKPYFFKKHNSVTFIPVAVTCSAQKNLRMNAAEFCLLKNMAFGNLVMDKD